MATREECIKAAMAGGISQEDASALVDEIQVEKDRMAEAGQADDMSRRIARRIMDKAEAARARAKAERRMAALNIVAHDRIRAFAEQVKKEGGDLVDALDALEALLVGSGKRFTGSRESVSRLGSSLRALWGGSMANELEKAGALSPLLKDRDFSDAVTREMIKPESTGDKLARQTADIFSRYLEDMRRQLNDAGADIGKLDNYAPQSHDTIKLRRAGEKEWVNYIAGRLDWDRTFPGLAPSQRRHALGEAYQNIVTGVRRESDETAGTSAFTPPRNLAASLGKERVLHFRDADAAVEYNRRFGSGNIVQAVIGKMEVFSRRLALMRTFGPNPEVMIRRFLDREARDIRDAHGDPSRILAAWQEGKRGKLAHYYRALSGETGTPENPTAARITAGARAVMSMAKLGGALLSSFTDIGIKAQAAVHAGEGWLEAWKNGLDMRFERFQGDERRELGRRLGVYTQGLLGELYSRFDVNDALSGAMTRAMNAFFKMSGLTGWTEAHRAAYTFHLSNRLARQLERGGAELLDPDYAAVLRKNGLLDRWDLLGKMVEEVDGEKYVIPENAARLTDADLAAWLPEHWREENAPAVLDEEMARAAIANSVTSYKAVRGKLKALVGKEIGNAETGMRASLSGNSLDKILSGKAVGKSVSISAHIAAAEHIGALFERARLVGEDVGRKENTKAMHRFFTPFVHDGEMFMAKISVKEFSDGTSNRLYTVEALETTKPAGYLAPEHFDKIKMDAPTLALYINTIGALRERVKGGGLSQEQWQAARAAEMDRMRRKLARDVMGYFADETGYAVLEPDARTRAAMYGSTKPGSLAGEMLRFAWQFKSFPVTYWQRIVEESRWQRASRQPEGGFSSWHDPRRVSGDVPAFIHFFLAATALGYVSMTAKDMSKGRTPRDITANPVEVTLAAIMQGGGLGLLGDFFLGTADRFGNQLASNLIGPVPQELTNLGVMTGQLARGEFGDAGETAVRFGMNNLPFANLWYTRMGMDYLVNFHLREMMSPGTLARSERKMKEHMNQSYFNFGGLDLTPSHIIRRGGGFR